MYKTGPLKKAGAKGRSVMGMSNFKVRRVVAVVVRHIVVSLCVKCLLKIYRLVPCFGGLALFALERVMNLTWLDLTDLSVLSQTKFFALSPDGLFSYYEDKATFQTAGKPSNEVPFDLRQCVIKFDLSKANTSKHHPIHIAPKVRPCSQTLSAGPLSIGPAAGRHKYWPCSCKVFVIGRAAACWLFGCLEERERACVAPQTVIGATGGVTPPPALSSATLPVWVIVFFPGLVCYVL